MTANLVGDAQALVLKDVSRYRQLCDALSHSRAARASQRDECFAFIERFVQGLIRFLKIPPEHVRLAPPDGSRDEGPLTVSAASSLAEDGFWRTGLHLTICGPAPGALSVVVALVLHVKKREKNFLFKLCSDGPAIEIPDASDTDSSPAYDFVFQRLLTSLRAPA
jgi:hypothetical protein